MSSIEDVNVTSSAGLTLDLTNDAGLMNFTSAGSTGGTLVVQGISKAVNVFVQDTAQSHTVTYNDVTGSADSATLGLRNVSGGTLTVAGVETLTLNSTGSANTLAALTTAAATTLNVTGDQDFTVTANLGATVETVDASAATGIVDLDFDGADVTVTGGAASDKFSFEAAGDVSVTGGAGNDTFTFDATGTFTTADTVAGGDGTADVLASTAAELVTASASTPTTFIVTGIERVSVTDAIAAGATISLTKIDTGINRIAMSTDSVGAANINFNAGASTLALAADMNGLFTLDAAGTATTDSLTISNTGASSVNPFDAAAVTTTDFETVTINTTGTGAATAQTLGAISVTASTGGTPALVFTGSNSITTGVITNTSGTISAAGMSATVGTAGLTMVTGQNTASSITGSAGDDKLFGAITTAKSQTIDGGAGDDDITAGSGNDVLTGGEGDDSITGGAGNDNIDGGAGDDRVNIASGTLTVADTIVGGADTDTLAYAALLAADDDAAITQAVSGFEILEITATASRTLTMSNFLNNTTFTRVDVADQGAAQTLTLNNVGPLVTDMRLLSGAAADSVAFDRLIDNSSNALTISSRGDLASTAVVAVTANDEETISISGSSSANDLTITTLAASDLKTLNITGAADVVIANAITGATALATVTASAATGAVTVVASNSAVAVTATGGTGVFKFTGGAAADTVTGGTAGDSLTGGGGADSMTGGEGTDYYDGGTGKDKIVLTETTAAADEVELSVGATTYDLITGFSAGGGANNDNLSALQATFGWNSVNNTTTVLLSTGATIKAAAAAADSNIITISTNVGAGTFADYAAGTITEADMEALVIAGLGATGVLDNATIMLVAIDDGTSTGIFKFTSGDGVDNAVVDTEIQIMAILVGVSDATTIDVADVLFS